MAHQSETTRSLRRQRLSSIPAALDGTAVRAWLIHLPYVRSDQELRSFDLEKLFAQLGDLECATTKQDVITVLTSPFLAAHIAPVLSRFAGFKHWVSVKLDAPILEVGKLPHHHAALLVFSRHKGGLKHAPTRVAYTMCPCCGKTTKDYGGKTHLYHPYGTAISDVWRDLTFRVGQANADIEQRVADLFSVEPYSELMVVTLLSARYKLGHRRQVKTRSWPKKTRAALRKGEALRLWRSDCVKALRELPTNSIDFCFADPPYNLNKDYDRWNDSMTHSDYSEWCRTWIAELARIVKPGGTVALLNIPEMAIQHFAHLGDSLIFQDWISWEALGMPARNIMPANYAIVCFSKGASRRLPGSETSISSVQESLVTLKELYCLRPVCRKKQLLTENRARQAITNLWWDIHRVKHNARRLDHSCQLPSALMNRLVSVFTKPGEVVLDCFNGVGTTTLCATKEGRRAIGIEISGRYNTIAVKRHRELDKGIDPFRVRKEVPSHKNNKGVKRLSRNTSIVNKRQLQLYVRELSERIGRLPSRNDVVNDKRYALDLFESHFRDWREVCAAARTVGMDIQVHPQRA